MTGLTFPTAQAVATLVAMTSNFALNNVAHLPRPAPARLEVADAAGCRSWSRAAIGALANVGIASYLFESSQTTWVLAALAGIAVGAVWNYAVTAVYTWHKPTRG